MTQKTKVSMVCQNQLLIKVVIIIPLKLKRTLIEVERLHLQTMVEVVEVLLVTLIVVVTCQGVGRRRDLFLLQVQAIHLL
jgi:hypothetical protein